MNCWGECLCVSQCLDTCSVLPLFCDVMLLVCFCFIDRRAKYLAPREEFSAFPFCCCCCPECALLSSCLECPLLFCYLLIPISPAYFLETLAKCTQMLPVMLGLAGLPILKINEKTNKNLSPPLFFGWESYILLHIIIIHRIVFYYISFLLSFTLLHIDRVFTVYYFN